VEARLTPGDGLRRDCVASAVPSDGPREWAISSMVSNRGGGFGSRMSIKPPFREEDSVPLRSSNDVFVKRAHHELLRRIGWLGGGFGSRIEEGLGERNAPLDDPDPAYWSEFVWCDDDEFEREFCDTCSTSGESGTKSADGGSAVRMDSGFVSVGGCSLFSDA